MNQSYLHNLWEYCFIKMIFQCGVGHISLEYIFFFVLWNKEWIEVLLITKYLQP